MQGGQSVNSRTPLIVGVTAAALMIIAIGYGMMSGGFVDGLKTVAGDPWGRVTLIDLAAGLLLLGAWIAWREGSVVRAVPWWIAMIVTGNLATGIYVVKAALGSSTISEFLVGNTTRPLH
jgi:uncharacterized membrane protein